MDDENVVMDDNKVEIDKNDWLEFLRFRLNLYYEGIHQQNRKIERIVVAIAIVAVAIYNVSNLLERSCLVFVMVLVIAVGFLFYLERGHLLRLVALYDALMEKVMAGEIQISVLSERVTRIEKFALKAYPKLFSNESFEKGLEYSVWGKSLEETSKLLPVRRKSSCKYEAEYSMTGK